MSKKLFKSVGGAINRRVALRRLADIAGGFLLGVIGMPQKAYGIVVGCCTLCKNIPPNCEYSNCACEWCWTCPDMINCWYMKCYECFETLPTPSGGNECGTGCSGSGDACPQVKCSNKKFLRDIPGCTPQ